MASVRPVLAARNAGVLQRLRAPLRLRTQNHPTLLQNRLALWTSSQPPPSLFVKSNTPAFSSLAVPSRSVLPLDGLRFGYVSHGFRPLSMSSCKSAALRLLPSRNPGTTVYGTRTGFMGTMLPPQMPLAVHLGSIQHLSNRPSRPPGGRVASSVGALGAGALLLAGKGKYLLATLKLTKFASLGSMLFTVGTYSMFFGLPYAAGMVGLILVHESGHALVMRRLGIPFTPMVFVPFMGAAVAMKRRPRDAYEEALVAFGGPVLGSAGALAVAGGAHLMDSQLLFALADFGFMINLFNLLPIGMMDGGRICGAVSPYAGVVGLGIGGSLIATGEIVNPIFYLIMLAGGYETFMRFYRPDNVGRNYYRITQGQRLAITAGYFGLVGSILAAMAVNEKFKKPPEVLQRERAWKEVHYYD